MKNQEKYQKNSHNKKYPIDISQKMRKTIIIVAVIQQYITKNGKTTVFLDFFEDCCLHSRLLCSGKKNQELSVQVSQKIEDHQ